MKNVTKLMTLMVFMLTTAAKAATDRCHMNDQGIEVVKHYEGFAEKAYVDGGSGRWAVGYGTQHPKYKIGPKTVWTEEKAERILRKELNEIAEILCAEITAPITSNQLAALVSLAYNVGPYTVLRSNLFKKVNALEIKEAARRFTLYIRGGGVVMKGLVFRRKLEQALFLTPDFVHLDVKATAEDISSNKKMRK